MTPAAYVNAVTALAAAQAEAANELLTEIGTLRADLQRSEKRNADLMRALTSLSREIMGECRKAELEEIVRSEGKK